MKTFTFTTVLLVSFLFCSCKKDRDCSCTTETKTTTHTYGPGIDDTSISNDSKTVVVTYLDSKKKDARANCLSLSYETNDSQSSGGFTTDETSEITKDCTLK